MITAFNSLTPDEILRIVREDAEWRLTGPFCTRRIRKSRAGRAWLARRG